MADATPGYHHLTHPGVNLTDGGIMPRRTNSSTILSETLSSQANSLRPMYDGGRLALARLLALVRTLEGVTSLPSLALRNCCFVIPLDHNPWFYRAARLFGEGSKSPP
jgi:hypothetical protein